MEQVFVKDEMIGYIVSLCERTRSDSRILQGASPRASLALVALSKATAWIQGRDFILPRDVRFVFHDCIGHRILWSPDLVEESARTQALDEILQSVKAPAIR